MRSDRAPARSVDRSRRRLLLGGPVAAAGAWVAPSVLTLDRVAAATGTCGAPSVQVDWSTGLRVTRHRAR